MSKVKIDLTSQSKKQERKPVLSWYPPDLIDAEKNYLIEEEGYSEEDAESEIYNGGYGFLEMEWESFTEEVHFLLKKANPDEREWKATVKNFGWQNQDGYNFFNATSAIEWLRKILPDTECYFRIYYDEETRLIEIQNFHHDSPSGNEWYEIMAAIEECELCGKSLFYQEDIYKLDGENVCKECFCDETK